MLIFKHLQTRKYQRLCAADNLHLAPFGFDIHRAVGESTKAFLRRLAEFSTLKGSNPTQEYPSVPCNNAPTGAHSFAVQGGCRKTDDA